MFSFGRSSLFPVWLVGERAWRGACASGKEGAEGSLPLPPCVLLHGLFFSCAERRQHSSFASAPLPSFRSRPSSPCMFSVGRSSLPVGLVGERAGHGRHGTEGSIAAAAFRRRCCFLHGICPTRFASSSFSSHCVLGAGTGGERGCAIFRHARGFCFTRWAPSIIDDRIWPAHNICCLSRPRAVVWPSSLSCFHFAYLFFCSSPSWILFWL